MSDWSKRLFSTVLAATLLVSNIQPAFAFAAEKDLLVTKVASSVLGDLTIREIFDKKLYVEDGLDII